MYMTINLNFEDPLKATSVCQRTHISSWTHFNILGGYLLLPGSFIFSSTHQSLMRLCMNFPSMTAPFWMDNVGLNNNQISSSIPQFRCLANYPPLGTAVFHLAQTQQPLPVFYLDFAFFDPSVCLLAATQCPWQSQSLIVKTSYLHV